MINQCRFFIDYEWLIIDDWGWYLWLMFDYIWLMIAGNVNLPINHRQHIAEDGTLTILDVQRNYDEGEYSCSAVNSAGEGSSRRFFIAVTGRWRHFNFYVQQKLRKMQNDGIVDASAFQIDTNKLEDIFIWLLSIGSEFSSKLYDARIKTNILMIINIDC